MPAALLRVPFAVALVAERDTVLDTERKLWSLRDRFDMMGNIRCYHPAVPLAVLAKILIPAHDCCRPVTVPLLVVRRIR